MENTYVIAWRSKSEPRWGQGKKLLSRNEAETLVAELNQDYPSFVHAALNVSPAAAEISNTSIINVDFQPAAEMSEREAVLI
jgi:hypothetical protein